MRRWLTLILTFGSGLLLVVLSMTALRWKNPMTLAADGSAPSAQADSAPVGIAAYEGVPSGDASSVCYFPFAHHDDPSGRSTRLYYQNASWSTASVTISLYRSQGSAGVPTVVVTDVLSPNARGVYPVSELVAAGFTGAAVVEADQSLACSAEILNESDPAVDMMAYRTPVVDATGFIAPLVNREGLAGWNSQIVVFNYGRQSSVVDIQFYDHNGTEVDSAQRTVGDHDTWFYDVFLQGDLPDGFDGWAHITADDPIAAVVLNRNLGSGEAVALTPWGGTLSSEAILPWVERDPPTTIRLYNPSGVAQSRRVDYHFAGDGSLDAGEDYTLSPQAHIVRRLADVSLPATQWYGAVRSTGSDGEAGMVALSDWGTAAAGYSSLRGHSGYFFLPDVVRYPNRFTAFTVWSQSDANDVTVEFYDAAGNLVFDYATQISQYVGLRFDLGIMPELGSAFEGSVRVSGYMSIAVVVEEKVLGLPPEDTYEPNDFPGDAYTITVGTVYDSYLSHSDDLDWYRVSIPQPSFLTITLDQLPEDYDLIAFGDLLALPSVSDSQVVGELADDSSVDAEGNLDAVGHQWAASGHQWAASGHQWAASGHQWAASAWSGTVTEQVHTIAFEPGTYFILVYAEGGRYSDQPYRLQVQAEPLAEAGACGWTPAYTAIQPTGTYTGTSVGTEPLTLILYNKTRLDQTYGVAAGNAISDALGRLADVPSVRGLVVPVDSNGLVSDTYALWSTNPYYCAVGRANVVAGAIRNQVISPTLAAHDTISYVVLVGGDEQIPFRRVPDQTTIANERTYEGALQAEWGALRAAFNQRYILTDDFYGTRPGEELFWRGRGLWLPGLAVGRLVETPAEILGLIGGYLSSDSLNVDTGLVTGYDFLTDSAEAIEDTFDGLGLDTSTLISENWDADDLREAWPTAAPDLVSVNAHFSHWQAFPADGSATLDSADILNGTGSLSGTLGFSMGCHAGLNVPDGDVLGGASGTTPDFPQALARRGGYWVGNTGYGYGMDDAIEASEMLMWMFAQELGREPDVPAGQAFMRAKQRYFGSLPSGGLSLYHEKAMIEATFYGLPMYRVTAPSPQAVVGAVSASVSSPQSTGVSGLRAVDITVQPTLTRRDTASGSYYSVGGEVQAAPGRPIQPRATVSMTGPAGFIAHGALLVAGSYGVESGFDPLIARPIVDVVQPEPDLDAVGWFPAKPFVVNRFGGEDRLVMVAGQYNGRLGVERLYSEARLRVYYSKSDDFTPPAIIGAQSSRSENQVYFEVIAFDLSDLHRVVVTYNDGQGEWETMDLTPDPTGRRWTGEVASSSRWLCYFVQAVDEAGNVTMGANKGLLFDASPGMVFFPLVFKGS